MSVLSVTQKNFEAEVLHSDKPVLVDLWAAWCGPCRALSPVVEELASAHPEVKVCKINVDEEPELASAFRVSSIPMLAVLKDGKVVSTTVGVQSRARIEALLK